MKDIRSLSREQIEAFFLSHGEKAFRAKQVYEWLWTKGVHTFEQMTNLSKETRALLEAHFVINHIKVDTMQRSEMVRSRMRYACMMGSMWNRYSSLPILVLRLVSPARWVVRSTVLSVLPPALSACATSLRMRSLTKFSP